jgi:hypothetical protein
MLKLVTYFSGILLGIFFMFFGLNGFFNFVTLSTFEGDSSLFINGLSKAPYFFPILHGLKFLSGTSIVLNRYKRLSLVVLFPIITHVLLFHIFMMPLITTIIPVCLFVLWLIQVVDDKKFYNLLFKSY